MARSDEQGGRLGESARERVADILRTALEPGDEAPIDDATRRLMLHLSIDPPPAPAASGRPLATPEASAPPPSLLRRVFGRKDRRHGAAGGGFQPKGRGSDRG